MVKSPITSATQRPCAPLEPLLVPTLYPGSSHAIAPCENPAGLAAIIGVYQ
ncbi:UNVERIFIED_CONTAM: hypothetical protein GTU68_058712 [Idotea baltica]|nr:hypothetical protein [Idotea baltica]